MLPCPPEYIVVSVLIASCNVQRLCDVFGCRADADFVYVPIGVSKDVKVRLKSLELHNINPNVTIDLCYLLFVKCKKKLIIYLVNKFFFVECIRAFL